MNKKGFTVIELIATISLIAVISLLLVKLTITLKEIYINGDMKTTLITKQGTMTDKIYKDLTENNITAVNACKDENEEVISNCMELVFNSKTTTLKIDKTKKTMTYENYTIKLGKEGSFGDITVDKYNSDDGNILNIKIPINNKLVKGDYGINIVYQLESDIEFDDNIVFDVINTGIKVAFNPNGGTVSKNSKQVNIDGKYGTLPTPKRTGYTFKGWHGKNLFDKDSATANKVLIWSSGNTENSEGSITSDYIAVQNNTTYVSKYYMQVILYDENKNYVGVYNNKNNEVKKFTIDENNSAHYVRICFRKLSDENMTTVNDLQLEEANEATLYEPYYIKPNTTVVQNQSHTVKAIWEPIIDYGTSIRSSYNKIYSSVDKGDKTQVNETTIGTWVGNFSGSNNIVSLVSNNGSKIITSSGYAYLLVTAGDNTVTFPNLQSDKWVCLYWRWGGRSGTKELGNINLLFDDNQSYTISQAVTNKYIEPLVPYRSADDGRVNDMSYVLENPSILLTGGSQTKAYSNFQACFKVKNKSPLKGVSFYTDAAWSTESADGLWTFSSDRVEFSL